MQFRKSISRKPMWMTAALVAAAGTGALLWTPAAQSQNAKGKSASVTDPHRQLLSTYCLGCHSAKVKSGGLVLEGLDVDKPGENAMVWEKVVRKLHGGQMPPQGMPRPKADAVDAFTAYLETSLDAAVVKNSDPGRAGLHRMNRTEYANAVRDLLAVEIDPAEYLPPDDESDGFDNIAEALRVSPTLLDQYMSASRKISAIAVGDMEMTALSRRVHIPPDRDQRDHIEGTPLGTRGGGAVEHVFPLDGDYDFSVYLFQNIVGYVTGLEYAHQLEIAIDGERVFLSPVGGEEDNRMSDDNLGVAKDTLDKRLSARVPVKAGKHLVSVAFIRRNSAPSDEPLELFTRNLDLQDMNGLPVIDHFNIVGPYGASGPGDTASRRKIFTCQPKAASEETACAQKILSGIAKRAYRRPVDKSDMASVMDLYQVGYENGGFEKGIQSGIRLILANPKFLFRSEPDPAGAKPGSVYQLDDLEIASRLSFFLWSSIPDDELIDVAAAGKLKDAKVLEQQVKRMLADPKADAMVSNFAGQWLLLRNLKSQTRDLATFPNFDDNLRDAFRTETELFFASIMREDRNVVDLLTADYTFLNERLAKHYGVKGIYGSHFRRVHVEDPNRRGILGQGSFLTVTSESNRTSPVKRGKYILETVLGTPPPAPPPNVPALKENDESGKHAETLRARLALHREAATCSTCHSIMDPLGLAFENFDAVGRWRTKEPGGAVDAGGQLADGTTINGPAELRAVLLKRPEQFVSTMTEKLMIYALGRGLEYYDIPVARSITRQAARNDYKFSSIVMGIVQSVPFQKKKVPVASGAAQVAE